MVKLAGTVNAHKRHTKDLIRSSDQEILLRLAPARTSSGVNPLFGDFGRETSKSGITKGPFKCLWYDALSARNMSSTGTGFETFVEKLSGQYRGATAFAELWLEDVLTDLEDISGPTWFDRAREVIYSNKRFEFLGDVKLGLATAAPYILMVVLKGGAGYVD